MGGCRPVGWRPKEALKGLVGGGPKVEVVEKLLPCPAGVEWTRLRGDGGRAWPPDPLIESSGGRMSKFGSESLLDFLRCKLCCGSIARAEGRNKGSVHACKTFVAHCTQPNGLDAQRFVQAKPACRKLEQQQRHASRPLVSIGDRSNAWSCPCNGVYI